MRHGKGLDLGSKGGIYVSKEVDPRKEKANAPG
jgi:hypothetical protein